MTATSSQPTRRVRSGADRCPGLSRPFTAADGAIVRFRLPGGRVSVRAFRAVLRLAADHGQPMVHLTSRGNLQVRGLPEPLPEETAAAARDTGLIPSSSHELVRNIVCSPMTGLDDVGRADLGELPDALDAALCADPDLAALPGRFLFALDDGRGDVLEQSFDLCYQALDAERGLVLVGDQDRGYPVPAAQAVSVLISLAREFLQVRSRLALPVWRIRELPGPLPSLSAAASVPVPRMAPLAGARPVGRVANSLVVGAPLGILPVPAAEGLLGVATALGCDQVRVTPWRTVVLPGAARSGLDWPAAAETLAEAGLVTDATSGWQRVTACIGLPECARSTLDTRAVAAEVAERLTGTTGPTVYLGGCERGCGAPGWEHIELTGPVTAAHVLDMVEAAR